MTTLLCDPIEENIFGIVNLKTHIFNDIFTWLILTTYRTTHYKFKLLESTDAIRFNLINQ